jgi:hypothetical protein
MRRERERGERECVCEGGGKEWRERERERRGENVVSIINSLEIETIFVFFLTTLLE